jgi:hypothetical protein
VLIAYPVGRSGAYTVPEGVTEICEDACFQCAGLSELSLPASLTRIGEGAFTFCKGLTELRLPEELRSIGDGAFNYCRNLRELSFGEKLEAIGSFAFGSCDSLGAVSLPESLRTIGRYAFYDCGALRSVRLSGAAELGENVFTNCPKLFEFICRDPESIAQALKYDAYYTEQDDTEEDLEPQYVEYTTEIVNTLGQPGTTLIFGVHDAEKEDAEPIVRKLVDEPEQKHYEEYRYLENYAKTYGYTFCPLGSFNDVKEDSYYELPVAWAAAAGVTGGTGDGSFSPKRTCTREQIVTFLWKAAGAPEPKSTKNPFADVKKKDYFYKAVLWAVENGITGGVGEGRFGVGQTCTREQAVSFLWRAKGSPEPKTTENPFTDVKSKQYYYKAVLWAVENGITGGVGNNKFGVGATCTRAQIVTFLYKAWFQ